MVTRKSKPKTHWVSIPSRISINLDNLPIYSNYLGMANTIMYSCNPNTIYNMDNELFYRALQYKPLDVGFTNMDYLHLVDFLILIHFAENL